MGLKKPKEMSYDEVNALALRLFRELEVAEESMSDMYRAVQDAIHTEESTATSPHMDEATKKQARDRSFVLRNLFSRYNNMPKKLSKLRDVLSDLKSDFRERASVQWLRVEQFLSLTNLDSLHRDPVTGSHVNSTFSGWENVDSQEETLFNENRLYDALGKDDARTVLALWRRFHEMRVMRKRIDFEDDASTPGVAPSEVMFLFHESELFQKMEHLLDFSKNLLPKLLVNPEKADKHTEPQLKNIQRQLGELFDRLKHVKPKKEKK